tara:strand:+ start:84 stop:575 length:492 start_codon:yes stop_codon:yes gene_type:complete
MQTEAAFAAVTTGTAIKTMLQVKPSATIAAKIVEWGISFDGFAAALPGKVELIETDITATVTAHATADITRLDGSALSGGDPVTNLIQVGTAATGYTATDESPATTIATVRNLDAPQFIAPTGQFIKQFPLGREPVIQISKFARIRVTFGTAVNCYCYMILEI